MYFWKTCKNKQQEDETDQNWNSPTRHLGDLIRNCKIVIAHMPEYVNNKTKYI